ncbi:MAG: hypothetical protein IJV22_04995 [Bacteroidales bacterium]|nr:hypothetical protein [Bacteroidales bacterium]
MAKFGAKNFLRHAFPPCVQVEWGVALLPMQMACGMRAGAVRQGVLRRTAGPSVLYGKRVEQQAVG